MREDRAQASGNRQALEEASAWFVDFRLGEVNGAARRRFLHWLRRSPDHIRAYIEISGVYARLPTPGSVPEDLLTALMDRARSREGIIPLSRDADRFPARESPLTRDRRVGRQYRRGLYGAVAAAMGAVLALAGWLAFLRPPTYETETAEERTITLDDGSRIELNARSKVRVIYSATSRRVELLEGEALFKVAHNPSRPFYVSSAGTVVRDVGTQFDVDRLESGTTVTVIEGRVEIQARSALLSKGAPGARQNAPDRLLELSAGEQATITPVRIDIPPKPNIAAATAWTEGQLEFFETPLSDVVTEFNRYSRRPLVLESPSLAGLRINGVYSSSDTASLILFLRNQPDITVTDTDGEIRISQK